MVPKAALSGKKNKTLSLNLRSSAVDDIFSGYFFFGEVDRRNISWMTMQFLWLFVFSVSHFISSSFSQLSTWSAMKSLGSEERIRKCSQPDKIDVSLWNLGMCFAFVFLIKISPFHILNRNEKNEQVSFSGLGFASILGKKFLSLEPNFVLKTINRRF